MEVSRMTSEEEAQSTVVTQIPRHPHACGPLHQATVISNSLSPPSGQMDNLSYPFTSVHLEKSSLKVSSKVNPIEHNHRSPSPALALAYSSLSDDLNHTSPCATQTTNTDTAEDGRVINPNGQSNSISPVCSSPAALLHHVAACSTADQQIVNGSSAPSAGCTSVECGGTPLGDLSMDINGHSGAQTPASPGDYDRAKMDLAKLDETIDYVLSNAISDDPVEGMFVLPCRMREPTQLSSPNLRANTPSSGHLASPSPSPTPSSPHSLHVTSPMVNCTTKAHPFLPSNNMSNMVASPLSRYAVDQTTGLIQLSPCGVTSQYNSTQCNTPQPLSFIHLYQDAPKPPTIERSSLTTHINQSNTLTPTFLSSNIPGFHRPTLSNFVTHPAATILQNCASPPKLISVRAGPTPIQNVALIPSVPARSLTAQLPVVDGSCPTRNVQLMSSPTSMCYVPNAVPSGAHVVTNCTTDRSEMRSSISFRQPIVPAQTMAGLSSISPTAAQQLPDRSNLSVAETGATMSVGKKRNHSASGGNSKRRKTSASSSPSALTALIGANKYSHLTDQYKTPHLCDLMEKLKSCDLKTLVSAPVLKPYNHVLPPLGGSDSGPLNVSDEDETLLLTRRGMKYSKGPLFLSVPKCFTTDSSAEQVDNYIAQNLGPSVSMCGAINRPKNIRNDTVATSVVCSSPEPLTFESHMMALFSSMHKSSRNTENFPRTNERIISSSSDSRCSASHLASKLLPIFSEFDSRSDKSDPDRTTPPLPLFHVPNPKLIKESSSMACRPGLAGPNHPMNAMSCETSESHPSVGIRAQDLSHSTAVHPGSEALVHKNPPLPGQSNITFTVGPTLTAGIPQIMQHITELLGVDHNAVRFEVTPSGAHITLDQNKLSNKNLLMDIESHLREHFARFSVNSQVEYNQSVGSLQNVTSPNVTLKVESTPILSSKQLSDISLHRKLDPSTTGGADSAKYVEESVSLMNLSLMRSLEEAFCTNCDKLIPLNSVHRKRIDELANSVGLNTRAEFSMDLIFCSPDCVSEYAQSFNCHRSLPADTESSTEQRSQTLVCDLSSALPIVLQPVCPKPMKVSKRQLAAGQARRKRNASGQLKQKRWRGSRWRAFTFDTLPRDSSSDLTGSEVLQSSSVGNCCPLRLSELTDSRSCPLCGIKGDSVEERLGRLLPLGVDRWIHLNCALWCYEVYETVGGSLHNVDTWIEKALETTCSHCNRVGAGLPCYNPRCTFCYHVSCAVSIGCMFFTDRGMYCPQHQPKESHPMQLSSLAVQRRVYINRDENAEVGSVIHEEEPSSVVRIGTLCLHNLGQLLPHQIESGRFHTRRHIYPVGFKTTRIYWSMRVPRSRSMYVCEICESDGYPLFRVTAIDTGLQNESVEDPTCNGVWQLILKKIERLRQESNFVHLFAQHLKGEDLYGLSEPHIVRAVESLPGVDCLHNYVFNFGRMELIAEMPLAINPSGCARSEPKMQTYVRRTNGSGHVVGLTSPTARSVLPGFRRSLHPGLSNSVLSESSKQNQSSRSQQYRRLKTEVGSNVILGRSRIQGLGLFAARDLEPQTMVIEYIGELIRLELANKREKEYEAHKRGIYMFRLDEDTVIDATVCGGLARYINHSCQPNCFAEHLNFGDRAHIVIITNRHIDKGEELCYDYNFDLEDGGSKIPCLCRAPNCRKWMN